ncbi:heat shock protein HslJ [Rhodococcus sp. 27YEA15]|uniref:META domain-containing protein n=1 Tax=Rhodococcus sp. 27YEA15 TaxID=3156259 RepID=UPI003C7ED196
MRIAAAVIGLLTLAAVTGCSSSTDSPDSSEAVTYPSGRTYISTAVDGEPIPGGGPLTLDFTETGRVSANAGCNTSSGSVEFTDGKLIVGTMMSTMMGCTPELLAADTWTSTLLSSTPTWRLDGDTLTIKSSASTVTFQDKKVVTPDRALVGTTWTVTSLISPDAISTSIALETAAPQLTIAADGSVTGTTGCNRMSGQVEVGDTNVTFSPLATTRMTCPDEVADIERQVLAVLDGEVAYTVDANTMTLRKADAGLILTAQS